ncbi:MAG TPA: hypothetical protein VL200_01745 [Lacunisphaera sp.]|jgi:ribosomal protein S27E|nr:hypothetical protein [Lacunisphaera sp.]
MPAQSTVICAQCGHLLATYSGGLGAYRQVELCPGVRFSVQKNALGEDIGWARCPKCRQRTRVNAAFRPRRRS